MRKPRPLRTTREPRPTRPVADAPEDTLAFSSDELRTIEAVAADEDTEPQKPVVRDQYDLASFAVDRASATDAATRRNGTRVNPLVRLRKNDGTEQIVTCAQLAFEIALYGDDLGVLADAYGMDVRELAGAIETHAILRDEIDAARKEVKNKSRLELRMRDMLAHFSHVPAEILSDPMASASAKLSAFTLIARLSGQLDPNTNVTDKKPPVTIQFLNVGAGADIKPVQVDYAPKTIDIEEE